MRAPRSVREEGDTGMRSSAIRRDEWGGTTVPDEGGYSHDHPAHRGRAVEAAGHGASPSEPKATLPRRGAARPRRRAADRGGGAEVSGGGRASGAVDRGVHDKAAGISRRAEM